tara:strand:- start:279 stop:1778 length:1500 start_codon:yes stop_codon:yes gene_type:complete
MEYLISANNISKSFPGVKALENVNFKIQKAKITSLVGENGAGKSTLMKILSGSYQPDQGEIFFEEEKINFKNPKQSQDKGISTIYQELMLIPELTILENVYLGNMMLTKYGMIDWESMKIEAKKILDDLGMKQDLNKKIKELGVAEMQLIEIAKALSKKSKLLIMDEPTASLAINEKQNLFNVVNKLKKSGLTIIFISHHLNEIFELSDEVIVLRDGRIVGNENIINLNENNLIKMMVGKSIIENNNQNGKKLFESENKVLEVKSLNRPPELNNINFDLKKGEILGFAGLMGAGRTELLRAIYGADKFDSGEIISKNKKIEIFSPNNLLTNNIGLAPEDRKSQGIILNLSVKENISLPSLRKFNSILFGIDQQKEKKETENLGEKFKIKYSNVNQLAGNLSGGNQQKIVLAKLLGANVDIYLLDEPTRGIDVGAKELIYNLIKDLCLNGSSVIVVSSVIEELLKVCDRILCLYSGSITAEFNKSDFDLNKIIFNSMGKN